MIGGNITGSTSDGTDKLFNLIALVSDPKLYETRLKELQDAIDKNEKYVKAVGAVDDVMRLRGEAAALKAEAEKTLADSRATVADHLAQAKAEAQAMIDAANKDANQMRAEAKQVKSAATAQKKALEDREAELIAQQRQVKVSAAEIQAKAEALDLELAKAKDAVDDAIRVKSEIIAKHRAFLETL